MRLRIHVGVDAEGDRCLLACLDRALIEDFELRFGFDVEAVNSGLKREIHLTGRLADTGEHDAACRNAGGERAAQFAFGNDVDAGAELAERLQHRLVRIRLHGVADHGVDIAEGFGEDAVVALKRCGRIAIERRADGLGDFRNGDVLGVKDAVAVFKVVHGVSLSKQGIEEEWSVDGARLFGRLRHIAFLRSHRARRIEIAFASASGNGEADDGKNNRQADEVRQAGLHRGPRIEGQKFGHLHSEVYPPCAP